MKLPTKPPSQAFAMDDISGRPLFPNQLNELELSTRNTLVRFLRDLSLQISNETEEGKVAEMLAGAENISPLVINNLTNKVASSLVDSVAKVVEESAPDKSFIIASLTQDFKLVALVLNSSSLTDNEFLQHKFSHSGLHDTVAGEIFIEVMIKKYLEDLAKNKNAIVCWEACSFLCDLNLGE